MLAGMLLIAAAAIFAGWVLMLQIKADSIPPHRRGCDCGECSRWHARHPPKGWPKGWL